MDAHDGSDTCHFDWLCNTAPVVTVTAHHAATLNEDGQETCGGQPLPLCPEHWAQLTMECLRVLIGTRTGICSRCGGKFASMNDCITVHDIAKVDHND